MPVIILIKLREVWAKSLSHYFIFSLGPMQLVYVKLTMTGHRFAVWEIRVYIRQGKLPRAHGMSVIWIRYKKYVVLERMEVCSGLRM